VSRRDGDYVPNLTESARASSIVFVPGDMIGPLAVVAPSFRDTTFVLLDRSRRDVPGVPPNVIGVTFREEQGSYAAGYLVGRFLEELHVRRPLLGSVGGIPIPPVRRFIDGFGAGAVHGSPGATMLVDYTHTFGHPERCRRAALRQIAAGAQAIFAVAGNCSAGVFDAAWRSDVWVIGVDSVRRAARGYTLATVLKRYDVAVVSTLRAAVTGRLAPAKDVTFGLRSGGIALAGVNPAVPRHIASATRSLSDAIAYASP